jgi:hypothetical protein
VDKQHNHEYCKREQQKYKPFVVSVAEAIVHEDAVVIKFLNASVAEVTVVSIFRSQVLTVDANVI